MTNHLTGGPPVSLVLPRVRLFGILFSARRKPPQSAAERRAEEPTADLERGGFSTICAERERARARFLTLRPAVSSIADEPLVR